MNSFADDLNMLMRTGGYSASVISEVASHEADLASMHSAWKKALRGDPFALEDRTRGAVRGRFEGAGKPGRVALGLAGPGAVGKETVARALGYPKVINTTTRSARSYEQDGVHYRFITKELFYDLDLKGAFFTVTDRPNRGLYGVQKADLESRFNESSQVLIEENPATLMRMAGALEDEGLFFVLVYLLPPAPVFGHLAARLANRCKESGEGFLPTVESTLGQRQVDEFLSVADAEQAGVPVLYLVNDRVDRAVSTVRSVIT